MAQIGIYSGAFDPVHNGHLAFALAAQQRAGLQKVVFLPEPSPRGKHAPVSIAHRMAMLQQATGDMPELAVECIDTQQFTVAHTLPRLQKTFAGDTLSLLIGSDVVQTFRYRWPDLEMLFNNMSLVIGLRGSDTEEQVRQRFNEVQAELGLAATYTLVSVDHPASSSGVKSAWHETTDVPASVAAYANLHNLYGHAKR